MYKFNYHIYYRAEFKIGKVNSLSRSWQEEKSGMDTNMFPKRQVLNLENYDVAEEEHVEDVELEKMM